MNRIQLLEGQLDSNYPPSAQLTTSEFAGNQQQYPEHSFFIPLHYERNYAYPLLVWLHGPGGHEQQLKRVMPHISLRNYVAVAPRGVVEDNLVDERGNATYTWGQDPDEIVQAAEDVSDCIGLASTRFNIARRRVFLVGYDSGGTMAVRLGLMQPELFAGVISLGGRVPSCGTPLFRIEQARNLPIMIQQSRDSDQYTEDQVCTDLRLLHAAGMSVTIRQYPGEQEVTTQMLADVNSWVMEQVTGPAANRSEQPCQRIEDWN